MLVLDGLECGVGVWGVDVGWAGGEGGGGVVWGRSVGCWCWMGSGVGCGCGVGCGGGVVWGRSVGGWCWMGWG